MADRTLTINHADGDSETYTIKRDKFAGVRSMSVDGDTVTVDHTAVPKEQAKETTFGGSQSITIKREIEPLLSEVVGGASAAYSLRDLNDKAGNSKVVRVRRASDHCERDFRAKEVKDIAKWVNTQTVPPLDLQELDADGHRTGATITAAAAYSLRNLSASYTGNVVEVRRSSDDAEESFTAAEVADGTLVAWVGAGNDGFVTRWYDQSGNDNHAEQTNAASRPKIVDAGVLVSGGIDFDGVDDGLVVSGQVLTSSSFYAASVMQHATGTSTADGQNVFGQYKISTSGRFQLSANNVNQYSFFANATDSIVGFGAGSIGTSRTLISVNGDGSNAEIWRDGTSKATDTYSGFTPANVNFTIGIDASGGREFNGKIAEVIIYNSDQSDNRTAIEANIGETYSIDLPSGVDTGYDEVDGFVETWYDQSGNGNDATQETAGNQPKIVDAGVLVSGGIDFNGAQELGKSSPSGFSGKEQSYFVKFTPTSTIGYVVELEGGIGAARSLSVEPYLRFNVATQDYDSTILSGDSLLSMVCPNTPTTIDGYDLYYQGSLLTPDSLSGGVLSGVTSGAINIGSGIYVGRISEVIVYNSDQSANRAAIETNINNQYDIY